MYINLSHICKSFGSKTILHDISIQLNASDKIGLVGRNGSGKTTLLRLIQGSLETDSGHITKLPQIRVELLQQIANEHPDQTVLDSAISVFAEMEQMANEIALLESEIESKAHYSDLQSLLDRYAQLQTQWELSGGYSYEAMTKSTLTGLGFDQKDFGRKAFSLSGGEQTRLNLARLLLSKPNLLLLDEPTNHLDLDAVRWLESFLQEYPNAYMVVSHDRYFLDNTVDKIFEISDGKIEEYPGNYSSYIEERNSRMIAREKAYKEQQIFIENTEEFIRRNLAGQKTKQAKSRRKMLEKMERLESANRPRPPANFEFGIRSQSGDLVLLCSDLTLGYDQVPIVEGIDLRLYRGQVLGIIGPNGSGKTTFLRAITGELKPLSGKIQLGQKVEVAYYEQQLHSLDPQLTVLEQMRSLAPSATDETLRNYLAKFLFRRDEVFHSTASLSGGERSRLALAKLIFGKANTLVFDEPTNHLDIPSCEALEEALQAYPGTLIIVSHDRYLINKLADHILYFDGKGSWIHFEGRYESFERHRAAVVSDNPVKPEVAEAGSTTMKPTKPMSSVLSKNEISKIKNRCEFLEKEIHRLEALLATNLTELNRPELARNYHQFKQLSDLHKEISSTLDQLYLEWEKNLVLLGK